MPLQREDIQTRQRDAILRLAAAHGARRVRLFGSLALGQERPDSDVDFLVDMEPGRSMLDLVALADELESLIGRPVDLVTEAGLAPGLRDRVRAEAVPL